MVIMGGKHRQGPRIVEAMGRFLVSGVRYVEPFCGAMGVAHLVAARFPGLDMELSDFNEALVVTWLALMDGWLPPDVIAEDRYDEVRNKMDLAFDAEMARASSAISDSDQERRHGSGQARDGRAKPADGGSDVSNPLGDGVRDEPGRRDGQDGAGKAEPRDDGAEGIMADASPIGCGARGQGRLDPGGEREPEQALLDDADANRESARRATEPRSKCGQWLPESGFCRVAHGVPAELDGGINEILQILRERDGAPEVVERTIRQHLGESSVLLESMLRRLEAISKEGKKGEWEKTSATYFETNEMRDMWVDGWFAKASQRQEPPQQYKRESGSIMPEVPQGRPPERRNVGNQWIQEPDIPRVARGVPERVNRLKCLGNSIVPQIAELIFAQKTFDGWRR